MRILVLFNLLKHKEFLTLLLDVVEPDLVNFQLGIQRETNFITLLFRSILQIKLLHVFVYVLFGEEFGEEDD